MRDHDRRGEIVDPGGQEQVMALGQSSIDGGDRRGRVGHEEVRDRDGGPGFGAAQEVRPYRAFPESGLEDVPIARVRVQERLLLGDRARRHDGVLLALPGEDQRYRRRALDPGEDIVPEAVRAAIRTAYLTVAGHELLVAGEVEPAADLVVGQEAAAREVVALKVRFGAERLEPEAAVDDDTADRRGLRHRPEVIGASEAVTVVDGRLHGKKRWHVGSARTGHNVEVEVGQRPPEVHGRVAPVARLDRRDKTVPRPRRRGRGVGKYVDLAIDV